MFASRGFFGSGITVTFPVLSAVDGRVDPTDSFAGVKLRADGTIDKRENTNSAYNQSHYSDWYTPNGGDGSGYWVRATVTAGTTPSGTVGSWVALTSDQAWGISRTTVGTTTSTFTLEIATDSGGSNIIFTRTGNYLEVAVDV